MYACVLGDGESENAFLCTFSCAQVNRERKQIKALSDSVVASLLLFSLHD